MATTSGLYTPPTEFVGQTPYDLRFGQSGQPYGGDINELARTLGIGERTPLENKAYALVGDSSSQPGQFITSRFGATSPNKPVEDALAASKGITEQAYGERQRQLEAEKQPLTERYSALIDELKRRETKETGATSTALAREYGKRGVPLSSGAYEQDLLGKTGDISQFYAGQQKDVGFEREDKLRELSNLLTELPIKKNQELNMIDQKIAELKSTGANQQQQMALEMYRDQKDREYNQQLLDLKKQEFELSKEGKTDPYSQFTKLGEGESVFDLSSLQNIFKNPKTYKEGGSDTLGLR